MSSESLTNFVSGGPTGGAPVFLAFAAAAADPTAAEPIPPQQSPRDLEDDDEDEDLSFVAPTDTGIIGRCLVAAEQMASTFNHGQVTFAHLLLAMDQDADAREKARKREDLDWIAACRAAFALLAEVPRGTHPAESDELRAIFSRAARSAQRRGREYQSQQQIAVKDVLDAVAEMAVDAPARQLLSQRLAPSPLETLGYRIANMENRVGNNIEAISSRVVELDAFVSAKLRDLGTLIAAIPGAIVSQPALIEELKRLMDEAKPVPQIEGTVVTSRPHRLLHAVAFCFIGLLSFAAGYTLH